MKYEFDVEDANSGECLRGGLERGDGRFDGAVARQVVRGDWNIVDAKWEETSEVRIREGRAAGDYRQSLQLLRTLARQHYFLREYTPDIGKILNSIQPPSDRRFLPTCFHTTLLLLSFYFDVNTDLDLICRSCR